jgi:Peptidase A4 family
MKKAARVFLIAFCVVSLSASVAEADSETPGVVEKCNSGQTGYSTDMAEVRKYSDGGSTYTYRYGGEGETFTVGQPPAGFDPEKSSDKDLERYSFPPRPEDVGGKDWSHQSIEEWESLVANYKEAAPPVACEGPVAPYSTNDEPVEYTQYAKNWSGWGGSSEPGFERYVAAIARFYEPSGNAYSSCKSNALVANWVGLGGWHSTSLIQAGTGTATNNQHTAWWMALSSSGGIGPVYYPELSFGPSSYMGFYAGYNINENKAYFYLSNESTGQVIPVVVGMAPKYYDGSTAEAITERPGTGEGTYYPLLNYNYETFWNVSAQNNYNTVQNIGETYSPIRIHMTNTGTAHGTLLASVSSLSLSQNYSNYYHACQ